MSTPGAAHGRPRLAVAGLGPGDPQLLTEAASAALAGARRAWVRGGPAADALALPYPVAPVVTAAALAEMLVAAAEEDGQVAVGVPGSPLVLEPLVGLLRETDRLALSVVPGISFLDLAWDRLGIDPVQAGVRLLTTDDLAQAAAATSPLLVAGAAASAAPPGQGTRAAGWPPPGIEDWPDRAVLLHRLGLPGERVEELALAEALQRVAQDDVTSAFVAAPAHAARHAAAGSEMARLAALIETLRARCPWDREQTHRSFVRHLLEEAYEAIEAIDALPEDGAAAPAAAAHLEEELGDLLCQVYFHATLAAETGAFDLAGVARTLREKLVARHPHVFGDRVAADAGAVVANWERGKLGEKGRKSLMDGIPPATPALAATAKVERKAAGAGLGIDVTGEAAGELASLLPPSGDDVGDLLFRLARLAAHAGFDPEAEVRRAAGRFKERFAAAEAAAEAGGVPLHDLAAAERLRLWHRC